MACINLRPVLLDIFAKMLNVVFKKALTFKVFFNFLTKLDRMLIFRVLRLILREL